MDKNKKSLADVVIKIKPVLKVVFKFSLVICVTITITITYNKYYITTNNFHKTTIIYRQLPTSPEPATASAQTQQDNTRKYDARVKRKRKQPASSLGAKSTLPNESKVFVPSPEGGYDNGGFAVEKSDSLNTPQKVPDENIGLWKKLLEAKLSKNQMDYGDYKDPEILREEIDRILGGEKIQYDLREDSSKDTSTGA